MSDEHIVAAELLDERVEFTLRDVTRLCGVAPDELMELIAEGIVDPRGPEPRAWRFTGTSVVRIQTALRLERDLGLNRAGAALVLQLLDDVQELRRRLRRLEGE
jgi:chaperone modulatory protein CbpM